MCLLSSSSLVSASFLPPDSQLFESALEPAKVRLPKILALCVPMPNRNMETVMEKERMALLLFQARRNSGVLALRDYDPLPVE